MKKVILISFIIVVFGIILYTSFNKKTQNEYDVVSKTLLNNGYALKGSIYSKFENKITYNLSFSDGKGGYYQACKGSGYDNCFTYYWEEDFIKANKCQYDIKSGALTDINGGGCSDDDFYFLVNLKDVFENNLKTMSINKADLKKLEDKFK